MTTLPELASHIASRLEREDRCEFERSGPIRHVVVDSLLPEDLACAIGSAFPPVGTMIRKRSLREDKFIAAQMDRYQATLEDAVFAFQQPAVLAAVSRLTGFSGLEPDSDLYAGGVSSMTAGQFLRPHLDNSHDKDRKRWRVLNLLYYVTPGWNEHDGGNLELWREGPGGAPIAISSRFNRLVVMETHCRSWHSVSRITGPGERRTVSNYFFSMSPADPADRPHVTTFRDPTSTTKDLLLTIDNRMRSAVRTLAGRRLQNPHVYKRS